MVGYTLECGHRFSLHDVVLRAIKCENEICNVCKTPFSDNESCFLSFGDPEHDNLKNFLLNWGKNLKEHEIVIEDPLIKCRKTIFTSLLNLLKEQFGDLFEEYLKSI